MQRGEGVGLYFAQRGWDSLSVCEWTMCLGSHCRSVGLVRGNQRDGGK